MSNIEKQTEETAVTLETFSEPDLAKSLMEQARQNLKSLGSIGMEHIIEAFKDRDENGHRMTSLEIREDDWDMETGEILRSRPKAISMSAEVQLEKSGGYTTVVLQFDDPDSSDMERFWAVFTEYGKSAASGDDSHGEVPVITLTAVPMTLGGNYGMLAVDPIYYTLQPSEPSEAACSQIRLLYQPESVLFLNDDRFCTEETIAKVKSELAGERLAKEAWFKKKLEKEAWKRQREQEMAQYLESRKNPHGFRSTKEMGHKESPRG